MKTKRFSLIALIIALAMVLALSACGGITGAAPAATSEAAASSAAVSAAAETAEASGSAAASTAAAEAATAAEVDLSAFASLLQEKKDSYYAIADIAENQSVLLLSNAESVYGEEASSKYAGATTIYMAGADGTPVELGTVESGGTANPIAVGNGFLYFGGHKEMYKVHVDLATSSLVYDLQVRVQYAEDGSETYFADTTGSGEWEQQEDSTLFDQLLNEYGSATPVMFAPAADALK